MLKTTLPYQNIVKIITLINITIVLKVIKMILDNNKKDRMKKLHYKILENQSNKIKL